MPTWRVSTAAVAMVASLIGTNAFGGKGDSAAAAGPAQAPGVQITRFLGEQTLPHKMEFDGTTVGGLSGMDRDPTTGTWYFISDDRARYQPARFYTGQLDIDPIDGRFTGVRLTGVTVLKDEEGNPYPGFGLPDSVDPETIRFDSRTRRLLWGQEGDRPDDTHPGIPVSGLSVRWAGRDGRELAELPIPRNLRMTDDDKGPRRNFGMEGVAIAPKVFAGVVEGPRYEDGKPPTTDHGALARITVWSRSGEVRGQYAYPIDPLPAAPISPTGLTDSGVSEILALDNDRYLVLERSWIEGVDYMVKLYEIDLRGATDVLDQNSLADGEPKHPISKRLVLDLGRVTQPVQNLETLAWGPRLATGECTLVIGSDDNFDDREVTQFLAFAAKGC